jgi:nitrate reductase delta subunit
VRTFDLTPEHALHLTHHLFGDDKNRGPALIDLTEYYKQFGLEIAANEGGSNELPDYLPLVLEFTSQLDDEEGRMFLSQWTKVLNQLATNLEKAESHYAPLVRLVEQRSRLGLPVAEAAA